MNTSVHECCHHHYLPYAACFLSNSLVSAYELYIVSVGVGPTFILCACPLDSGLNHMKLA